MKIATIPTIRKVKRENFINRLSEFPPSIQKFIVLKLKTR
jgi:hypothetical protein